MTTYEEFMVILTAGILLVAILTYVHKKQPSCPSKADDYFLVQTFAGTGDVHSPSGCSVKYIIAKYTKMSNNKNRPGVTSTRTAHISEETNVHRKWNIIDCMEMNYKCEGMVI